MQILSIIGNVGQEPIIRSNAKGEFAIVRVACARPSALSGHDRLNDTMWVDVMINAQRHILQYIHVGTIIYASGMVAISHYKSEKTGLINLDITLYADQIQLCGNTLAQERRNQNIQGNE